MNECARLNVCNSVPSRPLSHSEHCERQGRRLLNFGSATSLSSTWSIHYWLGSLLGEVHSHLLKRKAELVSV